MDEPVECESRAAKGRWLRSVAGVLKAARDLSHHNQHEEDDQNQSQRAARSVSPVSRVGPGRQSAHEEQNNDDEQNQAHGRSLLLKASC